MTAGPAAARPLRVLRLMSHLGTGGTEKQCLEVLAHLRDMGPDLGVRVDLATYCAPPFHHVLSMPEGVTWHRLDRPWTPRGALAAARALRPLLARYDVLHALLWPSVWVARLARPRIPLVASVHNTVQPSGPLGLKRLADRASLRGTTLVFNSEAGRAALAADLGFDPAAVAVVPNGKIPYAGPWSERSGVVCVARRSPQKRHDLLLQAAALDPAVAREGVAFVGQGTDAPDFAARAESVATAGGVRGLGEVTDPMAHIAAAHVLALPTDHEGLPNVILEAWNARTVVVASRAPGVVELVRHGEDGLLVENTPVAWARALRRLLSDAALRERLVAAGRARLEREFSLDAAARGWARVYRDAAGRSPT